MENNKEHHNTLHKNTSSDSLILKPSAQADDKTIVKADEIAFKISQKSIEPQLDDIEKKTEITHSLLNLSISEFIEASKNLHAANIARNLEHAGITNLDEKAYLTYLTITAQNMLDLYPYDRFLKFGSNFQSIVETAETKKKRKCVVWCTNLYLGLNRHPKILSAVKKNVSKYGVGCGTSAVSGGFCSLHKKLEKELANFMGKEDVILFPTGFTTNIGAISAIVSASDLILFDKECHASIINGILLTKAEFRSFRNNDPAHLEKILKKLDRKKYHNVFVIIESVYGMSGSEAPIVEYCRLKKGYGFYLFVDEAHSFGFYGKNGKGYCESKNCLENVDFFMSTLSKATASIGGFIACRKEYSSYMRVSSSAYMFQASMPPMDVIANLEALKIIRKNKHIRKKLWDNANFFRASVKALGFDVRDSKSPIVPIYISEEEKLAEMCKYLYKNGIYTNWISYPAVKKGEGRLRFIVSAGHAKTQIKKTLKILKQAGKKIGILK